MTNIKLTADIFNSKYGNLKVISIFVRYKTYSAVVLCDCGKEAIIPLNNLLKGYKKSCGCRKINTARNLNLTHGESKTKLYRCFKAMKSRCFNRNNLAYKDYGGRGITICEEWLNDFMVFKNWCYENGYNGILTLDRINNNEGYSPDNCRFTDKLTQAKNRRNVHKVEYNGKEVLLIDLWKFSPVGRKPFYERIKNGWSVYRALSEKPQPGKKVI